LRRRRANGRVGMPRVIITSSRDPSTRMRQFLNDLEESLPDSARINRGRTSLRDLIEKAAYLGAVSVIYVTSRRGNPGGLMFMRIRSGRATWLPYFVRILGVKLTVDMGIKFFFDKPRTGVVASMHYTELLDLLGESFLLPHMVIDDVEELRGAYDVIVLLARRGSHYLIQWLDGRTLGPRGPVVRCGGPLRRLIINGPQG